MKYLTRLFLIILTFSLLFSSCSKDKYSSGGGGISGGTSDLNKTSISAKWNINNSADYTSFEFNQSNTYIIATNSGIKTGSYSINGDSIALNNYGTMAVDSITESYLSFKLTTNSKNPNGLYELIANKAAEMTNSTNTALLCRTWMISSANKSTQTNVLFSQAGTYFISNTEDGISTANGVSYWAWTDGSENSFCYNHDQQANCAEDNSVQISNLTSTTLTITEGDVDYILVPANSSRTINYENTLNSTDKNPYSWIGY